MLYLYDIEKGIEEKSTQWKLHRENRQKSMTDELKISELKPGYDRNCRTWSWSCMAETKGCLGYDGERPLARNTVKAVSKN